jgi:SNF2 family DNA or RNA helicase
MIDLSQLWPHQLQTYEFGKNKPSVLDGSSSGTGKTNSHAAIAEYFLENGGSRVLITCPKTLVRAAWLEDLSRFFPDLSVSLAEAPEENRKKAFEDSSDILILNQDGMTWLAKQSDKWLRNRLGKNALLINDESHAYKNPEAQRTKASFKLAPYFVKRHCMSGTFAPNSVTELWSQCRIVDDGQRLGKRFTAFRNLMQFPTKKGPFTQWIDRPDSAEIVHGLLGDILIQHSFEECMKNVPKMDHRIIYYDLSDKHRKIYDELCRNAFLQYEGKNISAVNKAALAGKLLQCASGAMYNDPDGRDRTWSTVDNGRYNLIGDLFEGREHTICFFLWKHQRAELIKQCIARGLSYDVIDGDVSSTEKRNEIIKNMQAGKLRVLLLHPKSSAHGITLTRCTTVIFASPTYQADLYLQGTARIRRGLQDKPTESIIILARDTHDFNAYEVFTGKRNYMEALNNLFEGKTNV